MHLSLFIAWSISTLVMMRLLLQQIYIYIYRPYRNVLQWPSDDEQKETKWGRWKLTIIYLLKRLFVPSVRRRIVKSKWVYVESYQYIRENIEYSSSERASNTLAVSITRKTFRFYIYIIHHDWLKELFVVRTLRNNACGIETTTPVYTAHDFTNVKNIELSNLFELIFIRDHAWFIPINIYL